MEKKKSRVPKEIQGNLVLLAVSIALTLIAMAGFVWVVGIADWRGSNGQLFLSISDVCSGPPQRGVAKIRLYMNHGGVKGTVTTICLEQGLLRLSP
jgi:hypothetical protein